MARVKTFVNGGSLLPSDLDTIEDDYEVAFSSYKHVRDVVMRLDAPTAGTYVFIGGYSGAGVTAASALGATAAHYLDPNRFWGIAGTSTANPRTPQYSLLLAGVTNDTAVGTVTFTAGLYPVSGTAGTGAAQTGIALGAVTTGSTVAITSPTSGQLLAGSATADFAAPSAGLYALAVVVSASSAANSSITLRAALQMRQV